MPGEDLPIEVRIIARCLEAYHYTFPILLHIFYQVIHLKRLSVDCYNSIVLRVDLPVTVIIVNIQILDCLFREALPALQADQQSLYVGVEVSEI